MALLDSYKLKFIFIIIYFIILTLVPLSFAFAGNYRMEYFGYSYITDGGGIRFREAVNTLERNGLLFSDYVNYKGAVESMDVSELAALHVAGKLEKLSDIKIENLRVTRTN